MCAIILLPFSAVLAGYEVVGEGNLIPSQWDYLGEKRVGADGDDDLVFIPCEYFSERYWRFCFHYVSISMVGTTNTLSKMCLPAKASGKLFLKSVVHTTQGAPKPNLQYLHAFTT